MENKFKSFLNLFNGTSWDTKDPTNRDQCFDLAIGFCKWLDIPDTIFSGLLNASQIWTNPTQMAKDNFNFIKNTPDAIPQVGDIVVFGGKVGHVSIATGKGDLNTFESLDQNWFLDGVTWVIKHTYDDPKVLGWLRFKGKIKDDLLVCLEQHTKLVDECEDLKKQIKNYKDADIQSKKQLQIQQNEIDNLKKEENALGKKFELLQNETETKLARKDLDCQDYIKDFTTCLTKDFELKEENYKKTISDLEKQPKETIIIKDPQPKDFLEWLSICFKIYPKKK